MAKPCCGYPSRTAAVVAMRARGLPDRDIARRVGIEIKTVSALAISAERKTANRAVGESGWSPPRSALILPEDVKRHLRKPAQARRVPVYQLALTIVETAAAGGLIDAILDDGDAIRAAA